jgi:hypothetical protein
MAGKCVESFEVLSCDSYDSTVSREGLAVNDEKDFEVNTVYSRHYPGICQQRLSETTIPVRIPGADSYHIINMFNEIMY